MAKSDSGKSTREARIRKGSRRRRNEERAEVRRAILDAGTALFLKNGYEGFSLREVAEHIGYSPGTIYLYFNNRDDLLYTIADEGFSTFGQALRQAAETADNASAVIQAMGQAYVKFGLSHPAHYRLMFIERTDFMLREKSEDEPSWAESFQIWHQAVVDAVDAGYIHSDDPMSVSDSLWAALHGAVALAVTMPDFDEARIKKMLDMTFNIIENGLPTSS